MFFRVISDHLCQHSEKITVNSDMWDWAENNDTKQGKVK